MVAKKKKDSEFAVKFFKGTSEQYNSITPNPYTFYFIIDEDKVYLGDVQLSNLYIEEQINAINEKLDKSVSIERKTKQEWAEERSKIAEENVIYIYSNWETKEDDQGNVINIPRVKIGDGMGYLIDLPFIDDTFESHIKNKDIHVTLAQKQFWNNKVRTDDSEIDGQNLIFTIF